MSAADTIDSVHASIVQEVLESNALVPHVHDATPLGFPFYPVLIGGSNPMDQLSSRARQLIRQFCNADIDLKFIVSGELDSKEDPVLQVAMSVQDRFVAMVAQDKDVIRAVRMHTLTAAGIIHTFVEVHKCRSNKEDTQTNRKLIRIVYIWKNGSRYTRTLLDTGVYSNITHDMFGDRKIAGFDMEFPISFTYHDDLGLPVATCDWMFLDNLRMLVRSGQIYQEKLENKSGPDEVLAAFKQYTKYLSRYAIIYIDMCNFDIPLHENIYILYDDMQQIICKIGAIAGSYEIVILPADHRHLMQDIVCVLASNATMDELEGVFVKHRVLEVA